MKKFERIVVRDLTGRSELVGASMGESDRPLFEAAAQQKGVSSAIRFDWSGVRVATGSYLKAAYIPILSKHRPALILTSDLEGAVIEDMQIVLESTGSTILVARRIPRTKKYEISVLGILDSAYEDTLAAAKKRPYVTASELFAERKSKVGKTGWMNRLSRLYEMGLLSKEKVGKEYRYSFPKMEEAVNG